MMGHSLCFSQLQIFAESLQIYYKTINLRLNQIVFFNPKFAPQTIGDCKNFGWEACRLGTQPDSISLNQ